MERRHEPVVQIFPSPQHNMSATALFTLSCHMNFGHHLSAGGMAAAAVSRSLAHLHSWRTNGALREGTDCSVKRMGIKKTHTKTTRIHRLAEGMSIREGRNRSAERKSVSFHALMRSVLPALLSENQHDAGQECGLESYGYECRGDQLVVYHV